MVGKSCEKLIRQVQTVYLLSFSGWEVVGASVPGPSPLLFGDFAVWWTRQGWYLTAEYTPQA